MKLKNCFTGMLLPVKPTILCLLFSCPATLFGQNKAPVTPLEVGQPMSPLVIHQTLNYPGGTLRFADLKGKVVIIDFWATWCTACIQNFPKLAALEKQFEGKLVVIGCTVQSAKEVNQFLARYQPGSGHAPLPTIHSDQVLRKLFPHYGIPHYVWIGPDGRVAANTDGEEITPAQISALLEQKELSVKTRHFVDIQKPLHLGSTLPDDASIQHYSILYKGHDSALPSAKQLRTQNGKVTGLLITNRTLTELYGSAISKIFEARGQQYGPQRVILSVRDTNAVQLVKGTDGKYGSSVFYTYDLVAPGLSEPELYEQLLTDLNRYSDYTGQIEKRPVECYTLTTTDHGRKIKSKGGQREATLFRQRPGRLRNAPLSYLTNALQENAFPHWAVIDRTGIDFPIDLMLSGIKDADLIKKELADYGLALKRETIDLDMFVLRDKPRGATAQAHANPSTTSP